MRRLPRRVIRVSYNRDVKQVWFPGVHGDVGGAYYDRGLGDITLGWMMDEAATAGLEFRSHARVQLSPCAQGVIHDSLVGLWRKRQTRPRSVPRIDAAAASPDVSPEAQDRNTRPALSEPVYWATHPVGATPETREITAKLRWVPTGLYLEGGVYYAFAAEGEWLDARIKAGPAGPNGPFQPGQIWHKAVAPLDELIRRRRKKTENPAAEFMVLRVTRREPCLPWYSLVGVVANGRGIQVSTNRRARHETFLIGDHIDYRPEASGYL